MDNTRPHSKLCAAHSSPVKILTKSRDSPPQRSLGILVISKCDEVEDDASQTEEKEVENTPRRRLFDGTLTRSLRYPSLLSGFMTIPRASSEMKFGRFERSSLPLSLIIPGNGDHASPLSTHKLPSNYASDDNATRRNRSRNDPIMDRGEKRGVPPSRETRRCDANLTLVRRKRRRFLHGNRRSRYIIARLIVSSGARGDIQPLPP